MSLFQTRSRLRSWPPFILLLLAGACSTETRPFNHPNRGLYDRNVSRIELVSLIIQDKKRAELVRSKYIEIESLVLKREESRRLSNNRLTMLSSNYQLPQEEIRKSVGQFGADGKHAFREYVRLQLEIRKHTTEDEFSRLDGVR